MQQPEMLVYRSASVQVAVLVSAVLRAAVEVVVRQEAVSVQHR